MVFDNSEHTNLATTFQGSECTRVKLVTPEIREAAEFYAASMEIDHLLSENRTKAATRKLRALMKVVLENISDRTSEYISQIRKRWAPLIEIDACLKARRSKSATFQERIELVRIEFHDNPAALEFIDEF